LFAASFNANAVVIKHDILDSASNKIGEIEVELVNSALNTGINDSAFDDTISLRFFNLGDLFTWGDPLASLSFDAAIDTDSIEAGIEFFSIDANDVGFDPEDTWSYQLLYDAFDLNNSFIDVFTADGTLVVFDTISLGQAQLSNLPQLVSAPATAFIFTLTMLFIYSRRYPK
jgi:hypothetical protein